MVKDPLSYEQEQIWLLHASQTASKTTYNVAWSVALDGALDVGVFRRAFRQTVLDHEVLLGRVVDDEDGPGFVIDRDQAARVLREVDVRDDPEALAALLDREPRRVFSLRDGELTQAVLARVDDDRHLLVMCVNELVCDRASRDRLLTTLAAHYRDRAPALSAPFADHTQRQRAWNDGPEAEAAKQHFRSELDGYGGVELPFERTYALYGRWLTSEGAVIRRAWPADLAQRAEQAARHFGVSPLELLQAAHIALVQRHSGQPDVAIGMWTDNRPSGHAHAVGPFENLLPVRADLGDDPTFEQLVARVAQRSRGAQLHGRLPYPLLLQAVRGELDNDQLPLLMTAVGVTTPPPTPDFGPGLQARVCALHDGTTRLDITIDLERDGELTTAVAEYSTVLFSESSAERLIDRLARVLDSGLRDPQQPVSALALVGDDELAAVVRAGNETARDWPAETIVAAFDAQAERTADRPAVSDETGASLSYAQLRERADRLAALLVREGVQPGDRVGLMPARDAGVAVAVLGILKAGGAYVPLDPEAPADRLETILADCGAAIVVCGDGMDERIPAGAWRCVGIEGPPAPAPAVALVPASLAYVMYTSGTTGTPKGVLIEHGSVCAFVRGAQELYELTDTDRFAHISALGFDVSTFDLFGAFMTGAHLTIASEQTRRSLDGLERLLRDERISVHMGPPGVLELLDPGAFPALRVLAVGGEAYSGDFTTRWAKGRRFVNSYGPTETTVGVVCKDCTGAWATSPPIGRPMAQHRAYALDAQMRPVPVGVSGELYIGGPGVGRGYLGRPARTATAFVPDPFSPQPGARLYRTGDLVRRLPDGDLNFLGRTDRQVKISGVRIVPGEIEDALRKHPEVERAVVSVEQSETGPARLVAYVLATAGATPTVSSLRAGVAAWLAPNTIPNEWVPVDAIPLTVSGKVDRAALAALRSERPAVHDVTPARAASGTEQRLAAEIFAPVLQREAVGPDENFFELGGHSLQVLTVLAKVRQTFDVEIRVAQFFQVPTVAGVAAAIEAEQADLLASADADDLLAALDAVELAGTEA